MVLLDSATLSGLRTTVGAALTDSCAIQRVTQISDNAGGFTDSYATASTVPCRVMRSGMQSPDELILAGRLGSRTPFTVLLATVDNAGQTTDVRESDHLVVTLPTDVQTYEVIGVVAPTTSMVFIRVLAAREG